jgi:Pvc16 N-terminal domain
MSNHLAAAAVTATLRKTLQTALDTASPGINNARVTTLRPSDPNSDLPTPGVNVFLYQVAPSPQLRNIDRPMRRVDGSVVAKPQSAVELHYLMSFHGDEGKLEPQILLGIVSRALHSQPVITRASIQTMLADNTFGFMTGTDLQDAPDLVRVTTVPLTLEELSKLWSVVFQTPYVLSQVYHASAVFIDGVEAPQSPLPVAQAQVVVHGSMGPVIEEVASQANLSSPVLANAPILTNQFLVITGTDLLTEVTRIMVDAIPLQPNLPASDGTVLKVQLPTTVPAGTRALTVVQRETAAASPLDRASNKVFFQLRPTITASFAAGNVTVNFTPPVTQFQQVRLLLNQFNAPPAQAPKAFTFTAPPRASAVPASSLPIAIPGVTTGSYLVRVQVDGAESLLTFDTSTHRYNAPLVNVP